MEKSELIQINDPDKLLETFKGVKVTYSDKSAKEFDIHYWLFLRRGF